MPRSKRRFSEEFKLGVVQEVLGGESQASIARRHSVSANTILQWLKAYRTGRLGGEATGASTAEVRALEQQVADLQRLVGRKEEQIEFLKNGTPEGTAERRRCIAEERGSLTVRQGCALMDLPRSTFYYHSATRDEWLQREPDLQDRIEEIALDHMGYGYRRITAALHRQGQIVNHETVLKILRVSDLLVRPLRGFVITTDSRHSFPLYPNLY